MDRSGNSCSMPAWLCTVALMAFMVHAAQAQGKLKGLVNYIFGVLKKKYNVSKKLE